MVSIVLAVPIRCRYTRNRSLRTLCRATLAKSRVRRNFGTRCEWRWSAQLSSLEHRHSSTRRVSQTHPAQSYLNS